MIPPQKEAAYGPDQCNGAHRLLSAFTLFSFLHSMVLNAAEPVTSQPNRAAIRGQAGPLGGRRARWIASATSLAARADCSWCWGIPVRANPDSPSGRPARTPHRCSAETSSTSRPDDPAVLDAHSAIFPLESLSQLKPGTYAVQALLHINPDLNFPNAPGDLYSPVTTVRIDPAQAGTVRLELSQAVPRETLPVDSESDQVSQDSLETAQRFPRPADPPSRRRDPAARLSRGSRNGGTRLEFTSAVTAPGLPMSVR